MTELIFKGEGLSPGGRKGRRGEERSGKLDEDGGPQNGAGETLERMQRV